ncbi:MAG TPA: divalent metal cation transporter [Caldanaerobacter subterraneus]|uniref:Divalent metal cation transporter MntH n=1 Tax=Caldanaerobacter subterraneus TaxID=911092 RepID=A0A357VLI9_9THEO|nr:Nramp family divalent metal transporter [Caldanaerobacter subterraneus]HBT49128.1 divalent metal cation transporter [Caldanaerobacter subterraneus]
METREIASQRRKNLYLGIELKKFLKYLGPAFIVSVAYVDPGNFATNISGGSLFDYHLIWVILWSNVIAIFLQIQSAKLGIATGCNLPEMCSIIFPRKWNWFLWITAELAAMATDLAEFLGGTMGLYLLFHIPMTYAAFLTGVVTFAIVYMEKYGQKVVEGIIFGLVAVISLAYAFELFIARPDWSKVLYHTFIPSIPNKDAMLIAVGILGATVMPHVIYLHSQLVQYRNKDGSLQAKKEHLKMEKIDILVAMNTAFIINAAMLIVSAAVFYKNGIVIESIEEAHKTLEPLLGAFSSWAFGIALLASGFSSSAVGTMAGQTIMKGFVGLNIPLNVRRLVTMVPAITIIVLGIDPLKSLIVSQVVLSFELPMAIIPLLLITSNKKFMKEFADTPLERIMGVLVAFFVMILNGLLLYFTLKGEV